jgi:hypothetical protein
VAVVESKRHVAGAVGGGFEWLQFGSLGYCPVRAAARRFEGLVGDGAIVLTNGRTKLLLLSRQLWDLQQDGAEHPAPVIVQKLSPLPSLYLRTDSKSVASRRARLRFDRSGLNESRFRLGFAHLLTALTARTQSTLQITCF